MGKALGTVPGSGPGDSESNTATGSCTRQRALPKPETGDQQAPSLTLLAAEKLNIKLLIYPVPTLR